MSNIHVVVDSTAGLPQEVFEKNSNLHEVSLKIRFGAEDYIEKNVTNTKVVEWVKATNQFPVTSQPSTGDFETVLRPLVEAGKQVIVITISSALSGTYSGAKLVAKGLDPKNVAVISSGTVGYPMQRMAEKALEMAAQGTAFGEIVAYIEKMASATHTIFIPQNLDYLHKGGRIGGATTLIGNILQIKPILYLVDQKVSVLDKVRTKRRAIDRMLEEVKQYKKLSYISVVYIAADGMEDLQTKIQEFYPGKVEVTECSPVIAVHVGPAIGVMFQEQI